MLEARLEWAQDITLALSEFVDFPEVNLPKRTFTDPEEIKGTLHAFLDNGRDHIITRYSIGQVINRYIDHYKRVQMASMRL